MAFLDAGCSVSAICPSGHPLRFVTGIESIHPYRAFDPTGSLKAALRAEMPDLVAPCDDSAVWQLHQLYADEEEFRPLIERSLGAPQAYSILQKRLETLQTATELGIRVPDMQAIVSGEDLNAAGLEWPAVLKSDGTWGGDGVAVARDAAEARLELAALTGARRTGYALKRFLVNRHPLALWLWRRERKPAVLKQELIHGHNATTMLACWQGEVLASVTVEVLASQGATGAATIVRRLNNGEIERASRKLARRFMLSGFHGIDFVIEETSGSAYMIEMNPRATQLGHLKVDVQGNLAQVLASKLTGSAAPQSDDAHAIGGDPIAFFPRAWEDDPDNPLLENAFRDAPEGQPALMRELEREPWPERRLLNRILRLVRPRRVPGSSTDAENAKDRSRVAH
jgi:hypothetical protein